MTKPHLTDVEEDFVSDITSVVARVIPTDLVADYCDLVLTLDEAHGRSRAFCSLLPRLSQRQVRTYLPELFWSSDSPESRAEVLAGMATVLRRSWHSEALSLVQYVFSKQHAESCLIAFVEHFSASRLDAVSSVASSILDTDAYLRVRVAWCNRCGSSTRDELLGDVLTEAMDLRTPEKRAAVLVFAVPHLTAGLRKTALAAVLGDIEKVRSEEAKERILSAVAAYIPEELQESFVGSLKGLKDCDAIGRVFVTMAPAMGEPHVAGAIGLVETLPFSSARVEALCALAARLGADGRKRLMSSVLADIGARSLPEEALVPILERTVPGIPGDLLPEALNAALSVAAPERRAGLLAKLAQEAALLPRDSAYAFWRLALHASETGTREDQLWLVAGLRPLAGTLGGRTGSAQVVQAVLGVVGRWP